MVTLSVVLPVYNGERFLTEAVESILKQTFTDFELLAVDDGSTDRSAEILADFASKDARVKVLQQPTNQGLVAALNRGCQEAQGEYIVRMDADDVSLPTRFEKQMAFMAAYPDVGISGTWIDYIDEHGNLSGKVWNPPAEPALVRWTLLFGTPLAHPTWIMRRRLVADLGFYAQTNVEDYDLLVRASYQTGIANLPEILLHYRFWSQSKSTLFAREEAPTPARLMRETLATLFGIEISVEEGMMLRQMIGGKNPANATASDFRHLADVIQRVYSAYARTVSPEPELANRIRLDAATKIVTLGALAARKSPTTALQIAGAGLKLHPMAALRFVRKAAEKLSTR